MSLRREIDGVCLVADPCLAKIGSLLVYIHCTVLISYDIVLVVAHC